MPILYCKHPENLQAKHIPQLMFITRFYAIQKKEENTLIQHPGGYIQKMYQIEKLLFNTPTYMTSSF